VSIYIEYLPFSGFTCYSTSTRSSAGSQIFFLDKQFEICQNFSADENRSCPSQNIQNQKSPKFMLDFTSFMSIYIEYCHFSGFTCYSTSTRSSAASQIFFLDNQFEICQNFSADENRSCHSPNMKIHKSSKSCYIPSHLCQFT
jgi:deoxyadenosine/deoxycytidine kinase